MIPWDMIVTVVCSVIGSSAFWQFLNSRSGKLKEMTAKIDSLSVDIKLLSERLELGNIASIRRFILSFDSELRKGILPTQEEFVEVLGCIDEYEEYCARHPDFKNNKAMVAIRNINACYDKCQSERNYL